MIRDASQVLKKFYWKQTIYQPPRISVAESTAGEWLILKSQFHPFILHSSFFRLICETNQTNCPEAGRVVVGDFEKSGVGDQPA